MKVCATINAFYFYFQKVGIINKAINKTGVSVIHFITKNIKWLGGLWGRVVKNANL